MFRHAPTIRDVAPRIADVLRGHLFVAHNAAFDWRFVSTELSRYAGQQLSGEKLCTVRLARAVVPNIRRRSLDSLSYFYGIENHARHRAGGDALATAKGLIRLLAAARDRGCETRRNCARSRVECLARGGAVVDGAACKAGQTAR